MSLSGFVEKMDDILERHKYGAGGNTQVSFWKIVSTTKTGFCRLQHIGKKILKTEKFNMETIESVVPDSSHTYETIVIRRKMDDPLPWSLKTPGYFADSISKWNGEPLKNVTDYG